MGKFRGRSAVACTACHAQKVKCDGALPCGRCSRKEQDCQYPEKRETFVTLPQSYISSLEQAAKSQNEPAIHHPSQFAGTAQLGEPHESTSPSARPTESKTTTAVISDDCSAEGFIHDLRQMALSITPSIPSDRSVRYTYMGLKSDFIEPSMVIKLPSASLAFMLLDTFEEIFCDYHWFLRIDFRKKLELLYSEPETQSKDRNWLSRVSFVFALAATFMYGSNDPRKFHHDLQTQPSATEADVVAITPGSDLFEQGLLLFNPSLEEPTTEDVEVLNLMAFYCYSLNRRRTAYTYANQSLTLAKLLKLDKKPSLESMNFDRFSEHRRRLWWTSFCMERMVAAELGLSPAHTVSFTQTDLPWAKTTPPEAQEDFLDGNLLALQCMMCDIKCKILEAVDNVRQAPDAESIIRELWPCLEILRVWRESVPTSLDFVFTSGVPFSLHRLPSARGIASLYLRYHQCFTVLARPIYSRELSQLLQNGGDRSYHPLESDTSIYQSIQRLKEEGFRAAVNNCRILLDLFTRGKHARYGYWDAVHAFSSLSILSLSKVVSVNDDDTESSSLLAPLYDQCRGMLKDMVKAGNLAARDHDTLLTDVEAIVETLISSTKQFANETSQMDLEGYDTDFFDRAWLEGDWESFLNQCSRWV